MFMTRLPFVAGLAVFALLMLVAPSMATTNGEVTGTIKIDGKPLAGGKIAFHRDNGQFAGSRIKDGKYKVDCVRAGVLRVTLQGKDVPAKYASEDTSPLVVEVSEDGPNKFDFDVRTSKPN